MGAETSFRSTILDTDESRDRTERFVKEMRRDRAASLRARGSRPAPEDPFDKVRRLASEARARMHWNETAPKLRDVSVNRDGRTLADVKENA
jgi:hypothetical protein